MLVFFFFFFFFFFFLCMCSFLLFFCGFDNVLFQVYGNIWRNITVMLVRSTHNNTNIERGKELVRELGT